MTRNIHRFGFTLIELLVVMAIIAVLIGLLVPAVQKVRDQADLNSCKNNMHQLMVATSSYYADNKVFPPGNSAVFVGLLPYVEQANLAGPTGAVAAPDLLKTVPVYECPSNGDVSTLVTVTGSAETSYSSSSASVSYGKTDYAANGSAQGVYKGPFATALSTGIRVAQITDGLSNTIGFGEIALVNCHATTGPCKMAWSARSAVKGTLFPPTPTTAAGTGNMNFSFSSRHHVGGNFGFLDGSVQTIRFWTTGTSTAGPDMLNFRRLCGMSDSETYDGSLY